jgi:predicted membrane protein
MRKQNLMILGVVLVALGLLGVLGGILRIHWGAIFWPLALIALGAWMILRPRLAPEGVTVSQRVLGDIRRDGPWQVVPEEFSMVLGDVKLDMTEAAIPDGETGLRVLHILGSTKLKLPEGVGLDLSANVLIADVKFLGVKHEGFATPLHLVSEGYDSASKKIKLQVNSVLGDVRVDRA